MSTITKADATRFRFTKEKLARVEVPAGKDRVYVYDDAQPGLAFCLTATGATTFYVYRRVNGKPQRVRLGGYPSMSIETARTLARETAVTMDKGVDPVAERRREREQAAQERRATVTFADVFAHYLEHHAKPHKRTWREDEQKFNRELKPLHKRPIHKITRAEVVELHTGIGKRAPGHANRTLSLVSKVFNHAREHFDLQANPAQGVKRYPENPRERFLGVDELPLFLKALDNFDSPKLADLFRLLLLTGARVGNVQRMRFEHIDAKRAEWKIPAEEYKNGKAHTVNLSAEALEVIGRRRKATGGTGYVFPSTKSSTGYVKNPDAAWKRLLKEAGLRDLRIHDLRHTMGTWLASLGATDRIVGGALGHRSIAATRRYSHLIANAKMNPVRQAVEAATAAILEAARQEPQTPPLKLAGDTQAA